MSIKRVLGELNFSPGKHDLLRLKKETEDFSELLRQSIKKNRLDADVFVGGSFAKKTIVQKKIYDVDIFIRFDWEIDDISDPLENILKQICKKNGLKLDRIHGSRDYFHIKKGKDIIFELVPVSRIKKPQEARNVTDLSYFHVNYVRSKIKGTDLAREITIAKTFCKAQGVYGAESYIKGFSGYGLECLIIYYESFEKMLKSLSRVKERVIIDIEEQYKNPKEVLFELNESKLKSPIVLVDPTWKERNALAALSNETFKKFQEAASLFLKHPSKSFFEDKKIDKEKLKHDAKQKRAEFVEIQLETDRQEGDIAGTKLKKFSEFMTREIEKYFEIIGKEFKYDDQKEAMFYLIAKPKKEIVKIGPPLKMKEHAAAFRKANKNVFIKSGFLHSKMKIDFTASEFIKKFAKEQKTKLKEMSIVRLKIN